MAKQKKAPAESELPTTKISPQANKNFRARLTYKSGAAQDFLIVTESTTCFEAMRVAYLKYLNSGSPTSGLYILFPGSVVVDWRDVSSFHEWIE